MSDNPYVRVNVENYDYPEKQIGPVWGLTLVSVPGKGDIVFVDDVRYFVAHVVHTPGSAGMFETKPQVTLMLTVNKWKLRD